MSHVTQKDYQDALNSQTACNASGLIKSLAEVVDRIWEDAREQKMGTAFVNRHPIVCLYTEQLTFLSGASIDPYDNYISAYRKCEEGAGLKL